MKKLISANMVGKKEAVMKFFKCITMAVVLFFASTLTLLSSCASGVPGPRYFISLGDSVSSGFGLTEYDPPNTQSLIEGRHSSILYKKLKSHAYVDEYLNKAVSGLTTDGLLEILREADDETLEKFQKAAVITLNIGGNNILTPFLEHLSELVPPDGVDAIASGAIALFEAWQMIGDFLAGSEENNTGRGFSRLLPGIVDAFFGLRGLFAGGAEVRSSVNDALSVLMGTFPPELESALEEGAEAFISDFDEIINWLEYHAPNAILIVNTIYNPIPREVAGFHASIADLADEYISKMNEVIVERSETHSFIVVDLYSYFKDRLDLTRLNLDLGSDDFSFDIIHPSAEGHLFIAELHYEYFLKGR